VQFTSKRFTEILEGLKIKISMDGKGRALDNVFIERFWRSLKQEKIYRLDLVTVKDAKDAIRDYIEFYNTKRPHQSLDYKKPQEFYNHSAEEISCWNALKEEEKKNQKKKKKGGVYSSSFKIRVFKIIGVSRPHVLNVHSGRSTLDFESGILK